MIESTYSYLQQKNTIIERTPADHVISQHRIVLLRFNGGPYQTMKTNSTATNPQQRTQQEIMQQYPHRSAHQHVGHVINPRHENNDCHE